MQHDFILLDRSGSMGGGPWTEALNSINLYVKKLADDKVDTGVTLATFDSPTDKIDFSVIRDRITPSTWKPVSNDDAEPRGGTPLNDAIGKLVTLANAGFNGTQYDKVAIIIVTDGQENSSREFTHEKAKVLLDECRKKGWQVIFLGADFDNMVQAASYGNAAASTAQVARGNMAAAMGATASMRSMYGSGLAATMEYDDKIKDDLAKSH